VGSITRRNKDGRRKVDGKIANFYVHYEIDDEEATHVLEVGMYAHSAGSGAAAEPNQCPDSPIHPPQSRKRKAYKCLNIISTIKRKSRTGES
jgi:hypothetical protein